MTTYIFTGPTLAAEDARAVLDAIYLPPASQGDVYRVALNRPKVIGIIDGYFESVPAVWHKEILWALAQGIAVYGSASMGALRAAELAPFGMQGVGKIFQLYRDGALEDDDEVAVSHSPAEAGYTAQSEAMINIRCTLANAEADEVIGPSTRIDLERTAKALFYPERSYSLLLKRGVQHGQPAGELLALRDWLSYRRVDQKREDALAMLHSIRQHLSSDAPATNVGFSFEHTIFWEDVVASVGASTPELGNSGEAVDIDSVLEEVRLEADGYVDLYAGAMLHYLAKREAERAGVAISDAAVTEAAARFFAERQMSSSDDISGWLADQRLTRDQFLNLMREEALVHRAAQMIERPLRIRFGDHLRLRGEYGRVLARAIEKDRLLRDHGLENPGLKDTGVKVDALLRGYFDRLRRPVPENIGDYVKRAGFPDKASFLRALVREHCYVQLREGRTNEDVPLGQ